MSEAQIKTKGVSAVVSRATSTRALGGQSGRRDLGKGCIPLLWVDGWMMQPCFEKRRTRPAADLARLIRHFGPRAQSHGMRQAGANDSPGKPAQPVNILVGCSRDNGKQCSHQFIMQFFGFAHAGTSRNPYNRARTLIPFVELSSSFLRQIKCVSQPVLLYPTEEKIHELLLLLI
jgi:hypothetical protein